MTTGPQGQGVNANEAQLAAEHRAIVLDLISGVDKKVDDLRAELRDATSNTRGDIKEVREYFTGKIDKLEDEVQKLKTKMDEQAKAETQRDAARRDAWARLGVIVPILALAGGIAWWAIRQVAK